MGLGVRTDRELRVKGDFSPEKAHSPVPTAGELLSLGHTTQVLSILKSTPL